jgi:hypothetical protein
MYGLWLLILFVIIPAGVGAALAFVVSKDERPRRKVLLIGAAVGAVIGLAAGILLARF